MVDSGTDKFSSCMLMCPPEKCRPKTCCGVKENKVAKPVSNSDKPTTTCQVGASVDKSSLKIF